MNPRIKDAWEKAAQDHSGDSWEEQTAFLEKFAQLIINECVKACGDHKDDEAFGILPIRVHQVTRACKDNIKQHFTTDEKKFIDALKRDHSKELIGYTEREEGFYPMYAPGKGYIVTQAFIHCKYCGNSIYHCMGPRSDAVCLACYEKDPDAR